MGSNFEGSKAHVLMVPYPAQGHVTPMVQFGKRLTAKGIKVTVAYNKYLSKGTHFGSLTSIEVALISDGHDDGGLESANSLEEYLESVKTIGSKDLTELVTKRMKSTQPITAIVYDSFLPWVHDVAKNFSLVKAAFLTQSLAVTFIYYQIHKGYLPLPLTGDDISVPGSSEFSVDNAPSLVSFGHGVYPGFQNMVLQQFQGVENADWVFSDIFYELEPEAVDWFRQRWRLATVGPTIPSMYLDKRIEDDKAYGLNLFVPDETRCMSWLESKPVGSVVYVSFGSFAQYGEEQMKELALGLKQSGLYFIWVVRATEVDKLPNSYTSEVSDKGLVVNWSPQLDVLAHESVGCFVTHCGFNSVLEAVCLGVPMVAIPQWTDQPTNAKFVEDVWKIGIRAKQDETRVVRREVVAECVKEVMEGEKGKEMKANAKKWKELATMAISEGGSSDLCIGDIVANLVH